MPLRGNRMPGGLQGEGPVCHEQYRWDFPDRRVTGGHDP